MNPKKEKIRNIKKNGDRYFISLESFKFFIFIKESKLIPDKTAAPKANIKRILEGAQNILNPGINLKKNQNMGVFLPKASNNAKIVILKKIQKYLFFLRKNPTVKQLILTYAIFLFVYWYFSRYFNFF